MNKAHKYLPEQSLLIDLNSGGCFIGKFKNVDRNGITVHEVYNVIEDEFVHGAHIFHKNKIRTIRPYKPDIKQQVNLLIATKNNKDKYEQQDNPEVTLENLRRFNELIHNLIYLEEPGDLFDSAIIDMRKQRSIAVSMEIPEFITILTKKNLYIVDIRYMAKNYQKLARIFESKRPIKIIHDSRPVADCLKDRLHLHIRSVFDTLVAIIKIGGSTEDISLDTAVYKYLNVPSQFFATDGTIDWHPRPLGYYRRTQTGKNVLFLQRLYDVLIQKHLRIRRNFYQTCEDFAHGKIENLDLDEDAIKMCY